MPQPFRWSVTQAEARLAGVRTDFANLKTNLASTTRRIALARETVDLKQRDVDRKQTLLANRTGSQMDMDNALNAVVAAKTQLEQLQQQEEGFRNQLLGNVDLPIEQYPPYMQAFGRARPGQARPRPRSAARPDRRHRHAGLQHPARALRHGRNAGLQPDRRCQALGRCEPEGNRHRPPAHRAAGRRFPSTRSRAAPSRAWSRRSALAPARNSRSCRRRTRAETGSRSCSACRCASTFAEAEDVRDLRAGMSVTGRYRHRAGRTRCWRCSASPARLRNRPNDLLRRQHVPRAHGARC